MPGKHLPRVPIASQERTSSIHQRPSLHVDVWPLITNAAQFVEETFEAIEIVVRLLRTVRQDHLLPARRRRGGGGHHCSLVLVQLQFIDCRSPPESSD